MAPTTQQINATLRAHAFSFPGAVEEHPWGESVAKVKGKVFVFLGHCTPASEECGFSVKLPRSGVAALDLGFTEPTGYGLGKSGWVTARIREHERVDVELLKRWIEESYRAVAPKKLVAELDARAADAAGAPAAEETRAAARVARKHAHVTTSKRKSVRKRTRG